ncbi:MAG TPA: nitrilase-related carbon-nitrogen hydrolase [Nitrospirales bacterium]|jgi:predicted amidohydrolase|nr:nitrilase-related carbon-nitrogen hydrolase [Nitrospirales bacterium]
MKVGYFQYDPKFGEVKRNLDYVSERLAQTQCDLVVLPELFNTGYQFISTDEVQTLAEKIPGGPTTARLIQLAADRRMHLVAGLAELAGDRFYNSAILVGPKGFVGVYRKTHLFFEETLFFAPGDTGFPVFDIGTARVGLMVCFDWFYPESARTLALKGADIIAHPSNLVLPHCPDSMVTRCLENHVFAVTCNRIGSEERGGKKKLTYIGNSEVVSPNGKIIQRAKPDQEELAIVEINPLDARDKKINPYNDLLAARRPEFYST